MLVNLHVKNLALIEEENIDFDEGLNILSGETGAGKSIILGSINAALGSKTSPDFIRSGCEYGLSEITFAIPEDKIWGLYHVMTVNLLFRGKLWQIVHRLRLTGSLLHQPRPEFLHMN